MRKLISLIVMLLVSVTMLMAQGRVVRGTVISGEDGEPVIGASVLVVGTTTGAATDLDGNFEIKDVPADAKQLSISYIGFTTKKVNITNKAMKIILEGDNESLEEVVVVGYGTMRKKDLTSSIARVKGDDLGNLATASFDSQLSGRAAGVQVTTPSGVLGSTPTYRVRGVTSLSSSTQPLIIVDGVPVESGNTGSSASYNSMTDINPNDIESIEILKDGAASAIYGSRAANGVILITTKKGQDGKATVSYDAYTAWSMTANRHDLLNAKEFVEIANETKENVGQAGWAHYDGTESDWQDAVYRTGFQQNHSVSMRGGNSKSQYYASFGYTDQDGIVISNSLRRYTLKADISTQATKWLKIGTSLSGSYADLFGQGNGSNNLNGIGFSVVRMLPNTAIYDENDPTGYNIDDTVGKSSGRGCNDQPNSVSSANSVWQLMANKRQVNSTRLIGSAFAEITLMKGLTLKTQGGMDVNRVHNYSYSDAASGDGLGVQGSVDNTDQNFRNWNWQNTINYNNTFNEVHNVAATLLQEYTYRDSQWTEGYVTGLSDSFFGDAIVSNTYANQYVYGSKTYSGLASYMARVNYNYDQKYYVGASIRRDGLSKLDKDNRWGTFWGVSGAWRISRENFWGEKLTWWAKDLRIRASYATLGNSALSSDFPYLGTYGAKAYGAQTGIAWTNMGNNNLKWETTETYDLGLDGSLFGGKVSFELAYWVKNSKDLVMKVPTAPSMGVPSNYYYDNVGKVMNAGFEITLGSDIISTKDFTWHADINFSTLKNKVKSLLNNEDIITVYNIVREGESYKQIWGYDFYGVNKQNGNPIWRKGDGSLVQYSEANKGYRVYDPANPSDESKAGSLSASADKKMLGNTIPTWFGGFNNTFKYKDFDLGIFIRFSGGNKILNVSRSTSLLNLDFCNKGKEMLDRWQSPEKPGNGVIPRLMYGYADQLFNSTNCADSRFVENGAYLKLQTISLGYNLPRKTTTALGLSKLRIYAQAQNLFTITGYKGLDPETTNQSSDDMGVDWNGLPQQRSFTVGLNVTF